MTDYDDSKSWLACGYLSHNDWLYARDTFILLLNNKYVHEQYNTI